MTIVIEVHEATGPTPVPLPHTSNIRGVIKGAVTKIAVESVAGDPPVRFRHPVWIPDAAHEPVEITIVVVIADGSPHAIFVSDNG